MEKQPSGKPIFLYGTRHGTVFNLTPSNLPEISGVQLSVGDFYESKETIKAFPEGMTFKKFLGFKDSVKTYLSPYDFYKKEGMTGCEKNHIVKIKCSKGYTEFTAAEYDQIASLIKPDYMVALTEYPASQKGHANQSNKSHKRAINKTTTYLQKSKLAKQGHQGIKLLGAIHGAKNLSLLSRSMQQMLNFQLDGFTICDLCDKQTLQEREQIYKAILARLDAVEGKKFILGLAGLGKLQDIQHALKFGITVFEVNYPFILAQGHKALIRSPEGKYSELAPVLKKTLEPLDANCKCYTCERHSESYIAHLINCYELNAKILLSIHNLQMYIDFLATL